MYRVLRSARFLNLLTGIDTPCYLRETMPNNRRRKILDAINVFLRSLLGMRLSLILASLVGRLINIRLLVRSEISPGWSHRCFTLSNGDLLIVYWY